MAKAIYTLVDTDNLESYVWNNRDMFEIGLDSEGNELDDDAQERIVKQIVSKATDGRLEGMIAQCFDTWLGNEFNDLVYSTVDDFVYMAEEEVKSNLKG